MYITEWGAFFPVAWIGSALIPSPARGIFIKLFLFKVLIFSATFFLILVLLVTSFAGITLGPRRETHSLGEGGGASLLGCCMGYITCLVVNSWIKQNRAGWPTSARATGIIRRIQLPSPLAPEIEFLDISLAKDSSLLLHAIQSFYWQIFKEKPDSTLVLKYIQKNPRNKTTQVYSWIAFCRKENEGRKPDKDSSLWRLEFMRNIN